MRSINNASFGIWPDRLDPIAPANMAFANFMAGYHNRTGALNFADGHSQIKQWKTPAPSQRK
jgi:hypothetical protein